MKRLLSLFIFVFVIAGVLNGDELYLRENLKRANKGDFIVTAQNKIYTLLHIYDRTPDTLTIEEVTAPDKYMRTYSSWYEWISKGAPGHTSWVIYKIRLDDGAMENYFSFSKNSWIDIPEADNFLSTLLNLKLKKIPDSERKRVGISLLDSQDQRPFWQPKLVLNGQEIHGVEFDAWRTRWPKDGTELAGKTIEVFTPKENELYPAYFPYWLQISGMIGKAKVRIIDSGTGMTSPQKLP